MYFDFMPEDVNYFQVSVQHLIRIQLPKEEDENLTLRGF
ncbi:hypothetical protein Desaci_4146 [Desulfosporosinus acidiphilus SJ4]|uniref:Uncharacterized protein n=1 Tax=Desulfosporosinus acidiphilus (strain DSM 22704 / JCM 16185 / SJ4) TaxID=646529 RepID=I4DB34_DESAJ|nr:hypothetical protein Desaci_4146 [Desulfosporosinus acidiphilus SJ4]